MGEDLDVITPLLVKRNNDSESSTDTLNSFPNLSDVSSVDIINENEEQRVNHVPQIVEIEDGDTDDEDLISSVRNIFIKTYRPKLLKKSHGHKENKKELKDGEKTIKEGSLESGYGDSLGSHVELAEKDSYQDTE